MNRHEEMMRKAQGLRQEIIDLRRDFHQHPELALQEFATAKKIDRFLKEIGTETKMLVNQTGVRGYLRGGKPGKTIALRADIDALPVQEESEVPYKSVNAGVMHACGHDAHAAMLLTAARILAERRGELRGNVVFIFQPAEETGEGAKKMVEDGVLDGVDGIFGLHVTSSLDSGVFGYHSGPFMAAGDFFDVKIKGKGGHGGMPHHAIDPIIIAASAIQGIQTIISREIDPLESAVISICRMGAGSGAYNIIPDSATFGGTIRSLRPDLRGSIPERMEEILKGVTQAMRGRYEFDLMRRFPPLINDEKMTLFASKVARNLMGEERVSEMKPLLGSEDFSYYLERVPGSFSFLGARKPEKETGFPLHHPRFDINEAILPMGTALHVALALEYLNENGA